VAIKAPKVDYYVAACGIIVHMYKPQCTFTAQLQSEITLQERKKRYQKKVFIFLHLLMPNG